MEQICTGNSELRSSCGTPTFDTISADGARQRGFLSSRPFMARFDFAACARLFSFATIKRFRQKAARLISPVPNCSLIIVLGRFR